MLQITKGVINSTTRVNIKVMNAIWMEEYLELSGARTPKFKLPCVHLLAGIRGLLKALFVDLT